MTLEEFADKITLNLKDLNLDLTEEEQEDLVSSFMSSIEGSALPPILASGTEEEAVAIVNFASAIVKYIVSATIAHDAAEDGTSAFAEQLNKLTAVLTDLSA